MKELLDKGIAISEEDEEMCRRNHNWSGTKFTIAITIRQYPHTSRKIMATVL